MRLQRIGRKNDPSYRVIVTDSRNAAKRGSHVDHIGSYNPKANSIVIDGEKAKHWISKGVQVSDTVHNLLVTQKVIDAKKKNVLPKKSPIIDEAKIKAEQEAKEAAEAAAKAQEEAANAPIEEETPAETEVATEESETPKQEETVTA